MIDKEKYLSPQTLTDTDIYHFMAYRDYPKLLLSCVQASSILCFPRDNNGQIVNLVVPRESGKLTTEWCDV